MNPGVGSTYFQMTSGSFQNILKRLWNHLSMGVIWKCYTCVTTSSEHDHNIFQLFLMTFKVSVKWHMACNIMWICIHIIHIMAKSYIYIREYPMLGDNKELVTSRHVATMIEKHKYVFIASNTCNLITISISTTVVLNLIPTIMKS